MDHCFFSHFQVKPGNFPPSFSLGYSSVIGEKTGQLSPTRRILVLEIYVGVWSFLVSLELVGGRVEKENRFLPFNTKLGGKDIFIAEQRHETCFGVYMLCQVYNYDFAY